MCKTFPIWEGACTVRNQDRRRGKRHRVSLKWHEKRTGRPWTLGSQASQSARMAAQGSVEKSLHGLDGDGLAEKRKPFQPNLIALAPKSRPSPRRRPHTDEQGQKYLCTRTAGGQAFPPGAAWSASSTPEGTRANGGKRTRSPHGPKASRAIFDFRLTVSGFSPAPDGFHGAKMQTSFLAFSSRRNTVVRAAGFPSHMKDIRGRPSWLVFPRFFYSSIASPPFPADAFSR